MSKTSKVFGPLLSRRGLLQGGGGLTAAAAFGGTFGPAYAQTAPLLWYSGSATRAVDDCGNMFKTNGGGDVEYFRAGSVKLAEKIEQEARAKQYKADVVDMAIPGLASKWAKDGLILKYDSPEAAHFPAAMQLASYWVPFNTLLLCMAYNADQIKAEEAPKTWEDLLNPKWKGKMTMTDALSSGAALHWYGAIRQLMGKPYMEKLAKQDILVRQGSGDTVNTLTSGERPLAAMILDYHVFGATKKGANLYLVQPDAGVPCTYEVAMVGSASQNPAGAKKFYDFLISKDVQTMLQETQYMLSSRDDVPPPKAERGRRPLSEVKLLASTEKEITELFAQQQMLQDEWTDLFK
jgi:iron(III) transport system substrate-binding protein